MKNCKNTKKSLVFSALSVVLSFAMLAGGTLAWFSDFESGNNLINTGNLDVELKHLGSNGAEKVDTDTELFLNSNGKEVMWEPGAVATETFVVENAGTLALAYDLSIKSDEEGVTTDYGTNYLRDYLMVAVLPATVAEDGTVTSATVTRNNLADLDFAPLSAVDSAIGTLEASETEAYTVVVYWAPNANDVDNIFNLNNGGSGSYQVNLGIELNATQQASEYDSIDNKYDENPVEISLDESDNDDPFAK